jgi:hypothetical protein
MRRHLLLIGLLALAGARGGRAETTTYPAATLNLIPTGKVSIQLTVETGTYAINNFVFTRKYSYTVKNLGPSTYLISGFSPACDDPFATDPAAITPASKSAGWTAATFPLDTPVDPVWATSQAASSIAQNQSGKFVYYTNDPPLKGDLFLHGATSGTTRDDVISYWHPDCGAQITLPGSDIPYVLHGPFDLAQAYPAQPSGYLGSTPSIADNECFAGSSQGMVNANAVSGVLCLDSVVVDGVPVLNVNAFATCPSGQTQPFVQSYRLIKDVPGSGKCPLTYTPRTWVQFGTGVRTWWALRYTQPGTTFTLELTVRCKDPRKHGQPSLHIDRWTWRVTANLDTLPLVIQVLHTSAIGTLEIPCIAGEDTYKALLAGVNRLKTARSLDAKQDALFDLEALLIAAGAFGEVVVPEEWFPSFPPGNGAALGEHGYTGIFETVENPCVCKLLADLEFIGVQMGITSA